ncbi:MAG: hypothetical protein EOO45_00235 [Flavobacterium sp.]|nr:MAG: hypothetical protein EOO45_00235 [Flavobacterium sp.]
MKLQKISCKIQTAVICFLCLNFCLVLVAQSQAIGSFVVNGELNKFYPVVFKDGGFHHNVATDLEIGRSDVHTDNNWRGSVIAKFRFHTNNWGNGASFIDADIVQHHNQLSGEINYPFVAGWKDATMSNGAMEIILWLRGGGTTYHYKTIINALPRVYDGIANSLPFQEENGQSHQSKTNLDPYVNSNGFSYNGSAYFTGNTANYFEGNMGIGTASPKEKLSVNGNVRAHEIKVELSNWPDYVFKKEYVLPALPAIESYIKLNGHLPGMPTASEVAASGAELGKIVKELLKNQEQLTLYVIAQQKEIERLKSQIKNNVLKKSKR